MSAGFISDCRSKTVRIITGNLKGRIVPFNAKHQGAIRLTSARLKEAIFAMLGGDLERQRFLDLCAGCGQIGLEAYSRGAQVVMNEPDPRRHLSLKKLLSLWHIDGLKLERQKAQALVQDYQTQDKCFDYIYLDPPYHAVASGQPLVLTILEQIGRQPLLEVDGLLLVQHQTDLIVPAVSGTLVQNRQRQYGQTTLSIYQFTD